MNTAIELKICDAIDEYNDAVATGNDELAQMIHLIELRFKASPRVVVKAIRLILSRGHSSITYALFRTN